jgi:hypothetical protein
VLQDDLGPVHVGLDRVHGLFDDQLHADRRGEVKHDIGAIDQLREQRFVGDAVDVVREAGPSLEMGDVVDRAGRQVVDDQHLVSGSEQRFCQVRSDEPGAAGNQCAHVSPL